MVNPTIRAFVILFLSHSAVIADTVVLSNGDRVTGTIVTTADGKVTVKTEFMGEVKIDRKAIVAIEVEEPVVVTFEGGETVVGRVKTENERVKVIQEDGSEVAKPLAAFEAVRTSDFQRKWEREQKRATSPGWFDFWSLKADLGLAAASGNAQTTTLSSGTVLERVTGFDKTTLRFKQIYSTQNTKEPKGVTANAVTGSARYERDFGADFFVYGSGTFDFDEFQDLDLRSAIGGGLGWHIIRREDHTWDFGAGGNWNREKFSTGLVRNSAEGNLNEESHHQLTKMVSFYQGFSIFPNLTDRGEYRFNARLGADLKINTHLSVTFRVSNLFLSNPIEGNKKNDILLSTGLQYTWAQQ